MFDTYRANQMEVAWQLFTYKRDGFGDAEYRIIQFVMKVPPDATRRDLRAICVFNGINYDVDLYKTFKEWKEQGDDVLKHAKNYLKKYKSLYK